MNALHNIKDAILNALERAKEAVQQFLDRHTAKSPFGMAVLSIVGVFLNFVMTMTVLNLIAIAFAGGNMLLIAPAIAGTMCLWLALGTMWHYSLVSSEMSIAIMY